MCNDSTRNDSAVVRNCGDGFVDDTFFCANRITVNTVWVLMMFLVEIIRSGLSIRILSR